MLQIIKKDGVKGYENILRELCLENDESVSVSEALNGGKADGFGIYKLERNTSQHTFSCGIKRR